MSLLFATQPVEHLLRQKKTAVSNCHHCSLPIKRPVKHFESDGLRSGAGDGARTRDSLLGRQELITSPLASCEVAYRANLDVSISMSARLIKVFTTSVVRDDLPFPGRKYLPSRESNHLPSGYLPTRGWRPPAALPLLLRGNLPMQGDLIRLDYCLNILMCCMSASPRSRRGSR